MENNKISAIPAFNYLMDKYTFVVDQKEREERDMFREFVIQEIDLLEKDNENMAEMLELNSKALWDLKMENQKLKEAISILKESLDIRIDEENNFIDSFSYGPIDREHVKLLMEVLKCERK